MKGRKIVFINQATGYLTIDIVNAFAESGRFTKVALIAGSIRVQDVELDERVTHSKICLYDRGSPRRKLLSWLRGTWQIFWLLVTRYRNYEVFYVTIPPFAYLLSVVLRRRFSVLVFDVYPDVLQIYDIRPSHVFYRLWGRINRVLFRKAHCVFTIGEGMAKLLSQYVVAEKITVIPNWTGLRTVRLIEKGDNVFVSENGLSSRFIVQYSGNIGYTHNVELLLDVAEHMRDESDIFFLIIGRGEKFDLIRESARQRGLVNCLVLPFQPDNILNFTLAAADLGVVLLDERTAHVSVPSKIYNLQAVGVPILAVADVTSELAFHVNRHGNGACFASSDISSIVAFIKEVRNDERLHLMLKKKSLEASRHYTHANATLYVETYLDVSVSKSLHQPSVKQSQL